MKTKISFKRISMLIKANIVENYKVATVFWTILTFATWFIYLIIFITTLRDGANSAVESVNGLIGFLLLFAAGTILYTNNQLFKSSVQKLNISYKYTLPAKVSEKHISNCISSIIIAPLFSIAAFIIITILPTAIFHVTFDNEPFLIFSAVSNFASASDIFLNIIWALLFISAIIIIISNVYLLKASKKFETTGNVIAIIIGLNLITLLDYINELNFATTNITSYVIYPSIVIFTWILSYVAFKRKELKA